MNGISQTSTKLPQTNTRQYKPLQGSSKNRHTSLVHKPSPRSADIPVCRAADFLVCFPDERRPGSIIQAAIANVTQNIGVHWCAFVVKIFAANTFAQNGTTNTARPKT
jgi:hypothetical protein